MAIVVQKEDFLRPDLGVGSGWQADLRKRYEALSCGLERFTFPNKLRELSYASDPTIAAVRCVGNFNKERAPAFPRMHNKFIVFSKIHKSDNGEYLENIRPYGVWTGSFNLTNNAENSLENALYITDPAIVEAYFSEFAQIMALSEPLDWTTEWSAPEWRIGS